MNTIVSLKMKAADKKLENKKELYELVGYLLSLEENSFTGQLQIDFERGAVNQVAFNQKVNARFDLSVNE